jgi:hypothetical protein
MKINAKFRMPLMATRQVNFKSTIKYLFGIMDENRFIALIFTRWSSLTASPQQDGRAGGFHLLSYSGRSIAHTIASP